MQDKIIKTYDADIEDFRIYVADRKTQKDLGCFKTYKEAEEFVDSSKKECYIAY